MRSRVPVWLLLATLSATPTLAHADALADARAAIQKGDLRTAQINLRNAVRSDPQNGEAHYWLGRVSLDLGDATAAEREAREARDRGYDPRASIPLLAQSMLSQRKFKDLLNELQPTGKDPVLDASILVSRGYAQQGLGQTDDAKATFAKAEETAPNAVEPLLASARMLATNGDLAGALGKIDRALNAQPKSSEALLAKADIQRAKGDLPGALATLDQALSNQPGNLQAMLDRAGLLIATRQFDKAKADIDAVQKAMPGNLRASYLQAVLQVESKDFKTADATLEKMSNFLSRIPHAYYLQAFVKEQLGQNAQAEQAVNRALARDDKDFAAYKLLARLQFANRRPDLAADTLNKIVAIGNADAETYDLLGRAYAATGRSEDSVKAFQKAKSLAPNDVGLQTRLASARMGAGQANAAMGDLEHTLQLAPTAPQVGEALFFAALATGDLSKAASAVEQVRAAQGDTPVVGNLEGLLKLAQLDLAGAEAKFREVLAKHPDFTPSQINLARIAAMQGKPGDAENILTSLLEKDPAAQPALNVLAAQYVQTNRTEQAIALLEKAHKAQPANVQLMITLGDLYVRAGRPGDALSMLGQDKTTDTNINLLNLKASALLASDQKDQARDAYAAILKIDPSVLGARRALEALLVQNKDYERARNLIKEGMANNPRNYQLYQDYAMVDLKAGGVDAALATTKQLQDQDRDFPAARALTGDVYAAANRPADAVKAYQDALTAAPSQLLVTRLVAALLRDNQTDAAVKTLTDWTTQHPDDMAMLEQLANLEIMTRNFDDASKHLQAILAKQPQDATALNNLAWLYQQKGDKRAPDLAQKAYTLAPGGQTADTLGWILVSNGDFGRGMPLLRQAAAQTNSDPRILYHYAVGLKDSGNKAEAIKILNTVVANKAQFDEKTAAQKLLDELNKS